MTSVCLCSPVLQINFPRDCELINFLIIVSPPLFFPQMFMSEAGKISQKIKVWFSDYFNVSDFLAIVIFFIGFGLRLGGGEAFVPGRTVYCLNIIFWYVRLLDILAVNQQAGPYVMMIAKMVSSLLFAYTFELSYFVVELLSVIQRASFTCISLVGCMCMDVLMSVLPTIATLLSRNIQQETCRVHLR